jgi:hypothetical protein
MVAAGGGGGGSDRNLGATKGANGGYGGGLTGGEGIRVGAVVSSNAGGGTQTFGGAYAKPFLSQNSDGTFGKGGHLTFHAGGGGGGYYGGGSGTIKDMRGGVTGGGGGSSFISGMTGCVAIDPEDITTDPRAQDPSLRTEPKTMLNYNNNAFGLSPTWADGQEIIFTNPSMVDGAGYEWNTGTRSATPGAMPNYSGGTMTGNTQSGYARITKLLIP